MHVLYFCPPSWMTLGREEKPGKPLALNSQQASQVPNPPGCRLIAKWLSLTAATLAEKRLGQRACCAFSSLAVGCNVVDLWGDQLGEYSTVDLPPLHLASRFWTEVHVDKRFKYFSLQNQQKEFSSSAFKLSEI